MGKLTGIREPVRVLLIDSSIFTLQGLKTFLSQSTRIVVAGTARFLVSGPSIPFRSRLTE